MTHQVQKPEEEHQGPIWKHPYLLYIILTIILFCILILAAWLALKNGWLPNRRTTSNG